MRFELKTRAAGEQTVDALPDLAAQRLQTWNRTLDLLTDCTSGRQLGRRLGEQPGVAVVVGRPTMTGADPTVSVGGSRRAVTAVAVKGFLRISPDDDGASRVHAEWGDTNARTLPERLPVLVHHGPVSRRIRGWQGHGRPAEDIGRRSHVIQGAASLGGWRSYVMLVVTTPCLRRGAIVSQRLQER